MPRPQTARRGRGNFKGSSRTGEYESALQRLGNKVIYPKAANVNERNLKQKYKFVRNTTVGLSVVGLLPEQKIKTVIKKFIKSYYEAFDQPGRQNLQSLYSSDAFFSFSATSPLPTIGRNLLEVSGPEQRLSMLISGDKNIGAALATYPPTEHIETCQTIDIPYYMANPMSISSIHAVVTGVFKDTSAQTNPLRAFSRVFVLKHVSTDKQGEAVYQIFNDLFMLQPPTADQIKKFHQDHQAMRKLIGIGEPTNSSSTIASSASGLQTSRHREESMIKSIMAKTRMNRAGSSKLLQESNWDEEKALAMFTDLYQQNKIPQELFT